jgi:hypothetical protein
MLVSFAIIDNPGLNTELIDSVAPHLAGGEKFYSSTLAEACAKSVRKNFSNPYIVQFSDEYTPDVPGVDRIVRYAYNGHDLLLWRMYMAYMASKMVPEKEVWLHTDHDIIWREDPEPLIFDKPFDLAQFKRPWNSGKDTAMAISMPYNGGVTFGRGSEVLREVCDLMDTYPSELTNWWGDQVAVAAVMKRGKYKMLDLHEAFNYVPQVDEVIPNWVVAVHYKGSKRKSAMLAAASLL